MKEFIFTGLDGTEYDLKLNFLVVRAVDSTDYSAITSAPPIKFYSFKIINWKNCITTWRF